MFSHEICSKSATLDEVFVEKIKSLGLVILDLFQVKFNFSQFKRMWPYINMHICKSFKVKLSALKELCALDHLHWRASPLFLSSLIRPPPHFPLILPLPFPRYIFTTKYPHCKAHPTKLSYLFLYLTILSTI